jgi:transposase
VIVVAPSKVPRPVTKGAKTDRLDCIKLAEYAARGMLKGIAIPTEQEENERSLIRRRHDLADDIRRVKLRIRSLLLFFGVKKSHTWGQKSLESLHEIPLGESAKESLESLLRQLKFLVQERSTVQNRIAATMEKPEHKKIMECLQSVPGVGEITAATFRLEIFRPERFESSDQVVSLLGLAPTVSQSGIKKPLASIVPTGQKRLRSLLVESAWRWQLVDPVARDFYKRILGRTRIPQKAIVALARKLAIILWRIALEKRPYKMEKQAA